MNHTVRRFNRRRFLRCAFWGTPAGCAVEAATVEPEWVKVRTIRLGSGVVRHRFVHFTDLHFKGDTGYLADVCRRINDLNPDFVCFTGDFIEEEAYLKPALDGLKAIRAPMYAIPGNHDWWSGASFLPIAMQLAAGGGAWLQNDQRTLAGGRINLMGLDRLPATVRAVPGVFNLLLIHYPVWARQLGDLRADLVLAGHSHGGQVRVPGVGALITPSHTGGMDLGWFQTPAGPLYVNPGIGTFYLNVRFNCRPEITHFEIAG